MTGLPPLSPEDFQAFFQGVHRWDDERACWKSAEGSLPFPWQARLASEVAEKGFWPDLLDLPTSSGKTATIDVAVFHLALEAERGERRRAAMRIAFVVDRRLIVDDAQHRAKRLEGALADALLPGSRAPDVVRAVAMRLQHLAGNGQSPLVVRALRGGTPREDDWARTPCQPTVLCSTVDQVGSRLLFRGYGVSDSMKPLQAGLLGSDALILLDEAHLSQPFRQTAQAIARHRSIRGPDEAPFHLALLTATPGEAAEAGEAFGLAPEDWKHEILARRLKVAKSVVLRKIAEDETKRAEELAEQAFGLISKLKVEGIAAPIVGVIANRVGRAREAFEKLRAQMGDVAKVTLVIGRARAADRDKIADGLASIRTGVTPRPDVPHVIVATQTLEAGVDIDLDALVTDAASLDALRQRFGRVNRDGRAIPAQGVILADKNDRQPKKDGDPIYGEAIGRTLEVLFPEGDETVDFGVEALNARLREAEFVGEALKPLLSGKANAPVLMPAYVDIWAQTAPMPVPDPEPALFLHGPQLEPAGVHVIWRADFDEEMWLDNSEQSKRLRGLLALAPPRATEAVELPVWAVRLWLTGETNFDLGDVTQTEEETLDEERSARPRAAFRWCGVDDERSCIVTPREIRPGDVIVVPARYGGCDEYGWAPDWVHPVRDVFDEVSAPFKRKRYVVRISPGLIRQAVFEMNDGEASATELPDARAARLRAKASKISGEVRAALIDPSAKTMELVDLLTEIVPDPLKSQLEALKSAHRKKLEKPAYPYGDKDGPQPGLVLIAPLGIERHGPGSVAQDGSGVSTEDDETGSFSGRAQGLVEHSQQVERKVIEFARKVGLSEELVADIALAGSLHDAGKADLRFQRLLFDGDLLALERSKPLAKSARGRSQITVWERAGLSSHWRHEALSVRLALVNPRLQQAYDRTLVLWLVGVHHGHGRPFFPHVDPCDNKGHELAPVDGLSSINLEAGIGPQSLGFVIEGAIFGPTECDPRDLRGLDWPGMFRALRERYGTWGLARLEGVLRLADHRASEAARDEGAHD